MAILKILAYAPDNPILIEFLEDWGALTIALSFDEWTLRVKLSLYFGRIPTSDEWIS